MADESYTPPEGMELVPEEWVGPLVEKLRALNARAEKVGMSLPIVTRQHGEQTELAVQWDVVTIIPVLECVVAYHEALAFFERRRAEALAAASEAN